jgi:membrane-bound acyltransferase YfiQ involved in biofilm formation
MDKGIVYAFLSGIVAGKFLGFIISIIITAFMMFIVDPEFYSYSNIEGAKEMSLTLTRSFITFLSKLKQS